MKLHQSIELKTGYQKSFESNTIWWSVQKTQISKGAALLSMNGLLLERTHLFCLLINFIQIIPLDRSRDALFQVFWVRVDTSNSSA